MHHERTGGAIPESPLSAHGTDRLERAAGGAVVLTCARSKSWSPRQAGAQTRAEHPGTAVRWGEGLFEVLAAEPLPLPEGGVRYRLVPWDDRNAIRILEQYDEASEAARAEERSAVHRSAAWRWSAILLSPILGHLPGEVQNRLEKEHGAPARAMTIVSAIPILTVGVLGLLGALASSFGGGVFFRGVPPPWLCAWFVAESAVRIGSAWIQGQPMGSLAGVLLYRAGEAILGRKEKRPPALSREGTNPDTPGAWASEAAHDRYLLLEPLLSLLSEADQRDLEDRFGFDWRRWGLWTAGTLFVAGALNVLASLATMTAGVGSAGDALWLVAGSLVCAEQVLRWKSHREGRPRGSVLGPLVRRLAGPLFPSP